MNYESPIEIFEETVLSQYNKTLEGAVMQEMTRIGVYVDKHELIRALQYDRDQYKKGFHDGMMEHKWIPTSEQLPELDVYVLAYCDYFESGCFVLRRSEIGGWCDEQNDNWMCDKDIVAWMPLPEPYEEDE